MNGEIIIRIVLESPVPGVEYGLQKGSGTKYETVQKQRAGTDDLVFECSLTIKFSGETAVFLGPYAQGPANKRFVYIDIGTYAGQIESDWNRRLKIPLTGITPEIARQSVSDSKRVIVTFVAGTGKDGGPNCGTVKPFKGWELIVN